MEESSAESATGHSFDPECRMKFCPHRRKMIYLSEVSNTLWLQSCVLCACVRTLIHMSTFVVMHWLCMPAKCGTQQNCPKGTQQIGNVSVMVPQLRAGSINVDLAQFKKAVKTVLFISSFCRIEAAYTEFNMTGRGFFSVQIKQVIKG